MTDKLLRAQLARAAFALNTKSALPALVLMTDEQRLADPVAATCTLPRGSMVILRAKNDSARILLAAKLRPITRRRGIKLLIAGDAELAQRIGADGVHLPEARAKQASRWRARHPDWIITAAAHSLRSTHIRHVDAVILAPIFPTRSHPGGRSLGPVKTRLIALQVRLPIYALGGINATTARQLRGAKLAGFAAVDALAV